MESSGPLRAFRDHYVARFGGLSYDLAPGAVGVHPDFVEQVPELPGQRVMVSHENRRATPRFPLSFRVVVLDHLMKNARGVGEAGTLVFSTFDLDDPDGRRFLDGLEPGDPVYLNAALNRLPEPVVRRPGGLAA